MGESGGGAAVEGACESAPSAAPSALPSAAPSAAPSVAPSVTANVGAMCRNDFKLSEGAAGVCASIADFASPAEMRDLFVKTSLENMFTGIEANAAKV